MDASQISIKINQTPQPSGVKTNPTAQSDSSECTFDQIFAMIYSIRQSGNSNGELGELATESESSTQGLNKLATGNLSPEDMKKLDAILTSLITAMQQSPQSNGPLQNQSLLQAVSGVVGSIREGYGSLANTIQMSDGTNQTKALDPKQLVDGLTQLLNEISTQEEQNQSDLLPNIKGELQKIIDSINNTNGQVSTVNSMLNNNSDLTMPPELILDKNQVIFSNMKEPTGKSIKTAGKTVAIQPEFQMKADSQSSVIIPNIHGQGGLNDVKSVQSSPTITVSEFTPEMSELIGRTFKITNGESGSAEAKFSLYPEHLGPIEVKIVTQQGLVSAQIVTNTTIAKDALEGQLQHLKDALQQQGIVVQKLEITQQTPTTTGSNQTNLSFFQNGSNSSNEQRNHPAPEESSKDSSKQTQNGIEREIVQASYGASASKTASSIDFSA